MLQLALTHDKYITLRKALQEKGVKFCRHTTHCRKALKSMNIKRSPRRNLCKQPFNHKFLKKLVQPHEHPHKEHGLSHPLDIFSFRPMFQLWARGLITICNRFPDIVTLCIETAAKATELASDEADVLPCRHTLLIYEAKLAKRTKEKKILEPDRRTAIQKTFVGEAIVGQIKEEKILAPGQRPAIQKRFW
ncbi:hypothetical protein EVAR_73740_1 [Eumeta japonica]|uniref:Uncharacterized protein n=1 Tax=Eumeta variegata TaxID=151549 RepID=A0A4C1SNT3_EUMVA|nr:hypothetical protein EVAR_73740_1 [Eumeta japonica]